MKTGSIFSSHLPSQPLHTPNKAIQYLTVTTCTNGSSKGHRWVHYSPGSIVNFKGDNLDVSWNSLI